MEGLGDLNWEELFSLPKDYWSEDAKEVRKFMEEQVGLTAAVVCLHVSLSFVFQVGPDLPALIGKEMDEQVALLMSV